MARILVVDDDELIREYVSLLLEESEYQIDVACDGMQALKMIRESAPYELVITDLQMPPTEWGGKWLVEKVGGEVPVLILSERGGIAQAVDAIKAGAVDYVQKSSMDQELVYKIEEVLYERKMVTEEVLMQAKQYYQSLQQMLGESWDILSEDSKMMLATSEKTFHNHYHDITYDFSSAGNPLIKVIERESNAQLIAGLSKRLKEKNEDFQFRALNGKSASLKEWDGTYLTLGQIFYIIQQGFSKRIAVNDIGVSAEDYKDFVQFYKELRTIRNRISHNEVIEIKTFESLRTRIFGLECTSPLSIISKFQQKEKSPCQLQQ